MSTETIYHNPVLIETCDYLRFPHISTVVDATAGEGGHSVRLAQDMQPGSTLVLVDAVPERLEIARRRVSDYPVQCILITGNFRRLAELLKERGIEQVDGVLYDQGLSSADLVSDRGFSFQRDAPLDMRRDETASRSAADLLRELSQAELARIFRDLGDEKWAVPIARAIVRTRKLHPITRTSELKALVERVVPRHAWPPDVHVATRVMMALRYAVNDDINAIKESIRGIVPLLRPGARVVVLSYSSTEDRAVKVVLRELESPCTCPKKLPCVCGRKPLIRVLTRRGIRPTPEEVERNHRARSAVARVAERITNA